MPTNVLIVDLLFILLAAMAAASRWRERADRDAKNSDSRDP